MQSRIVLPNWICHEIACIVVVMSRNVWHPVHQTVQWRLIPDSNEPNFVNTAVAKLYSHFKVSNVSKVAIFYAIVLIPLVCCSFRYTFIIYWNAFMRNSWPKRTEWNEDLIHTNTMTNTHPNSRYHHVTFLNRGRNKPKLPLVRRISDMLQTTCPPTCPLVQVLVHFVGPKLDALDRQNSGQCKGWHGSHWQCATGTALLLFLVWSAVQFSDG